MASEGMLAVLNGLVTGFEKGLENRRKRSVEDRELALKAQEMELKHEDVRATQELTAKIAGAKTSETTTTSAAKGAIDALSEYNKLTDEIGKIDQSLQTWANINSERGKRETARLTEQREQKKFAQEGYLEEYQKAKSRGGKLPPKATPPEGPPKNKNQVLVERVIERINAAKSQAEVDKIVGDAEKAGLAKFSFGKRDPVYDAAAAKVF